MPLIAHGKVMLNHIGGPLHDLYFDVPPDGFRAPEGQLRLRLSDQDSCLDEPVVTVFDLTVCNVASVEVEGRPESGPGEDMFNEFEFDRKRRILTLKCCMAIKRIKCSVERLHVELEQVI
jgi:hypothetical protein